MGDRHAYTSPGPSGPGINQRVAGARNLRTLNAQERTNVSDRARGDLPGLYAAATAFVYPSLWEGFGLPVLEAMACGVPAVTYNVSSLPEVAGDAAVLLDPPVSAEALATALARVLDDPAIREELIARGRARARAFDWRDTARATLAAYAAVAA